MKALRSDAKANNVAFLIIHHIKKPSEVWLSSLEDHPTMTWLFQACGARALINQTDVRIAFDVTTGTERANAEHRNAKAGITGADVGLVVKWFTRLRGEQGPLYLGRSFDDDGEPIGYRPLTGLELLYNQNQQATFQQLPSEFTFTTAKKIYGRRDQATSDFLQKCIRAGILDHVGRVYRKTE